ncbi:DHA2 family efflux MFS transporter permease subunit [Streptomyces sp. MK37H]|uniref:DHA2 family efflux MFS transporter permease subunit n=1 Tax=Streptomyces sp. MK37H TaxID=2699117 RepID=UPI001B39ACA3|nr:DHA2 family efflux MFS transporter permease subunit [Streptomyces sp. MK37H]MBP8533135.1 DHA2 family efflux MFS transporter permease subunit [Streptomyces sp. MK37H]
MIQARNPCFNSNARLKRLFDQGVMPMKSTQTPPSAEAVPSARRRTAVLAVMCLALAVVVGMLAALLVAAPDLARDLRATEAELQWIMNAYGVAFAGLLLTGGALGDRYGRKRVLLSGLTLFGLASAGAVFVDDVNIIITLRGVAGVGAALVMPMTLAVITHVFPPEERGRAVGTWSGISFGSALLGVLLAGGLLEAFSWRSVFAANALLAALALLAAAVLTPPSKDPESAPLDAIGSLLSVAGIGALVYGTVEGPERGWTDTAVLAGFGLGAAGVAAFITWELRCENPLLDPRVFRLRGVSAGSLIITAETLAMFGFFFLLLQYLQQILGYSPFKAGLTMIPMAVAAIVVSPAAPPLAHRYGIRAVMGLGMAMIAGGLGVMVPFVDGTNYWPVLASTALLGAGIALAATPATDAILAPLPPAKQGVASALNDVTRELGGVLGIAILGSVFNTTYRSRTAHATREMPGPVPDSARDSLAVALHAARELGGRSGARLADATRDAFHAGMINALVGGVVVVVAGAVAAMVLLTGGRSAAGKGRPPADHDS